jgi:hypothetical protein
VKHIRVVNSRITCPVVAAAFTGRVKKNGFDGATSPALASSAAGLITLRSAANETLDARSRRDNLKVVK